MLLHLTLAAHTHTHMQTGPWGVFSPEDAICTCLFGMQRALPPLPVKPIPPLAVCGSTCPHLAFHYVYLYICGIIFPFVCACMICLFVVCAPPCVCVGVISFWFVCCKTDFRVWCWLFLKHEGLIFQWWETSCCARQRDHLKSFIRLPAECVNLPRSSLSWKLYGGVQLNKRSGLFCHALF